MPQKPATACRRPGCPGRVRDGVCSACGPLRRQRDPEADRRRGTTAERGYGGTWQKVRQMQLARFPLCQACLRRGRVNPALDVDHIVPKRWGGRNEDDNLQSLCHSCHAIKTQRETKRGKWSGEKMAKVILVGGPPGAGKTHYVQRHKGANDVIVDLDALVSALTGNSWYERTDQQWHLALDVREFLLLRLLRPTDLSAAWVITSAAKADERDSIAEQCGAAETIMVLADEQVCVDHIRRDERRRARLGYWQKVVGDWWQNYRALPGEKVVHVDARGNYSIER